MLRRWLLLAAFSTAVCSLGFALFTALHAPPDLEEVREHLIGRRYAEAARAAEQRLASGSLGADETAELRFLLAHARLLAGDASGARAALEVLIEREPAARWTSKARFELADLDREQGRHADAARIFRERVEKLIAPERKREVAAIYRRFALEAAQKEPPDFARARAFYDLAAELGLPKAEELEVRFAGAEAAEKLQDFGNARERFGALRAKHGDGEDGRILYHLAHAELRTGAAAPSRAHFEDLLRAFAASAHRPAALRGIAESFGLPQPAGEAALERGVVFLRRLIAEHPQHELAAAAAFDLGAAHFHLGRFAEAAQAWQQFVSSYGTRDEGRTGEARVRIGECAEREQHYDAAIAAWRVFLSAHPFHPQGPSVQERIASAEIARAVAFGKMKRWDEARAGFEEWLGRYPLDARAAAVLFDVGAIERARERFDAAITQWERVASKYPGTDAASQALYAAGETLEVRMKKLEAAVATYRRCNFGAYAGAAAQRLAVLEEQTLSLRSPRVYRSMEKVEVALATRNVEKVRVRIYAIDLANYFAATRGIGGVENLDIEIIQPTRTFDHVPPDYEKHREILSPLDLAVEGPGAWVVKVDDGRVEATVLALRSDVELISRATKKDLVVYAEDVVAGKAAPKVKLWIADGGKVLFEGETDERGLFYKRDELLEKASSIAVFAATEKGAACSGLDLSALASTQQLEPRGFLFTDRAVYEPGETVRAHAFVREAKDGAFAFEPGSEWTLSWLGPDGALLSSGSEKLGEFGSAHARFDLGAAARLGTYTLRLHRGEQGPTFSRSFEVRRVERKALRVEIEVAKPVLYRGEPVQGTARASFFHGGPAPERRITVQLSDGTLREGRTDAGGAFAFEFPTADLLEEQELEVRATLPEEGVGADRRLRLAVRALELELSTLREIYTAGESFDVSLLVRDPLGVPQAVEAELAVYRLVDEDGTRSERLEKQLALPSDAEGRGKLALALSAGGSYRLRASAVDRFANRVHAVRELFVSGEEDEVKLRVLAERDTLEAGVAEDVRIVSRLQPTRVLVTRLGDGIRSYEVRELPRGETRWTLDVQAADAPNFAFALAAIEGSALHEASKFFRVERKLEVALEPLEKTSAPGAKAQARLRVRGAKQAPVDAEVVLAVVDEAFLALYPDATPSIVSFFDGERAVESRASSSCVFVSLGAPRPVPQALVAEEQRREERRLASLAADPAGPSTPGTAGLFGSRLEVLEERAADGRHAARFYREDASDLPLGGGGAAQRPAASVFFATSDVEATPQQNGAPKPATGAEDFHLGLANKDKKASDRLRGVSANPAEPAEPELRTDFRATAWFGVVTIRTGEASAELEFDLPDSTTSWRWTARALTRDAAGGEARAQTTAKLALEARLDLPAQLVEGDKARVRAHVRNTSGSTRTVTAKARAEGAAEASIEREMELADGGAGELELELDAQRTGAVRVKAEALSANGGDALERAFEVRPNAVPVAAREAGIAGDSVTFELALASELAAFDRRLSIELERAGPEALLELALLGGGAVFESRGCPPIDLLSRAIVRASTALDALRWAEGGGQVPPVAIERLRAEVASAIARLAAAQREDGGFEWIGVGGSARRGTTPPTSDAVVSARAHAVLARAAALGFAGAAERATASRAFLENVLKGGASDPTQARILASLALEGRAEFAALNRLLRRREALGGIGLGFLALACARQDRVELAREVLGFAKPLLRRDARGAYLPSGSTAGLEGDEVEASAALLAAVLVIDPRAEIAGEIARGLEASRRRASFGGDGATELAVHALFARAASSDASGDRFAIDVQVNGRSAGSWQVPSESARFELALAEAQLAAEGPQKIALRFSGVGSFRYAASLDGLTKQVERVDVAPRLGRVTRTVRPAAPQFEGRELPEGFSVVDQPKETWTNKTDQVARGHAVRIETTFQSQATAGYLVLEDPIPAGTELEPGSVAGGCAHWESAPGRLLFFFAPNQQSGGVQYRLLGRFEGRYRHLPSRVWSYVDPSWAMLGRRADFTVLGASEASTAEYRATPDELYHAGERYFARGDLAAAAERLEVLLETFTLRKEPLREALRMVFLAALERGLHARIVEHFEGLKDRYPELTITFEQMLKVGEAYVALGEHERATDVFRGIAEASFLREMGVAGTLEEQGQFLESLAFVQRLLREYPDLGVVEAAGARLPQWLQARVGTNVLGPDGKPLSSRDLLARAIELAREHLVAAPEGALADEVAFGLVSAHLAREEYPRVLERSAQFSGLFGSSAYLDDFLYAEGYADFALGRAERALGVLDRVAREQFPDGRGKLVPGSHRDLAVWMRGQIHHAAGRVADAIAAYGEVKTKFSDAAQAIEQLERRELFVPEVTRVAPGAAASLEIKSRNSRVLELRVYPVDLVRLYVLQRTLDDMTRVQLAGIQPLLQRSIQVAEPIAYVERTTKVELPIEALGAYLVVVRAGELSAAGMVIRTAIELDVWNAPDHGLVRVAARDEKGEPLARAHVKVVGTEGGEIQGRDTDLRGIASFDGVGGRATLIVQSGEQVAFWRAPKELVPRRAEQEKQVDEQSFQEEATRGFFDSNRVLNESGGQQLEQLLRSRQQGVEVYRVRK